MKVAIIIGEPSTGKTYILKSLLSKYDFKPFKYEKLNGYITKDMIVLGVYDGSQFDGTDKLAFDIQPTFTKFIKATYKNDCLLIFEGDRLANSKTLKLLSELNIPHKVFRLKTVESILSRRRYQKQHSESFLKSKRTKVQGLQAINILEIMHNNEKDTAQIISEIEKFSSSTD